MTESTQPTYTFIALGQKSWGAGTTPGEAKRNQRRESGGKDTTVKIGHWSEPVTDVTVTLHGDISWANTDATLTWLDRERSNQ